MLRGSDLVATIKNGREAASLSGSAKPVEALPQIERNPRTLCLRRPRRAVNPEGRDRFLVAAQELRNKRGLTDTRLSGDHDDIV